MPTDHVSVTPVFRWATFIVGQIAAACDVHKDTVSEICRNLAELPKSDKAAADHATDFDPPIYNVWKQQTIRG
jgi:hypothetical protein